MDQEPLQINITLNEIHIKEAIRAYLEKNGYDVLNYNYDVEVRTEKQDMGRFSKSLEVHHFDTVTVEVKRIQPVAPKVKVLSKNQTEENQQGTS